MSNALRSPAPLPASDATQAATKLSAKQGKCLYSAVLATERGEHIDPWVHGSTTISTLKRLGFIVGSKVGGGTRYQATGAGLAYFGHALKAASL